MERTSYFVFNSLLKWLLMITLLMLEGALKWAFLDFLLWLETATSGFSWEQDSLTLMGLHLK